MQEILVIKLGGILLNSDFSMKNFFKILHDYKIQNKKIVIVHGGTFWAKSLLQKTLAFNQSDSSIDLNNSIDINTFGIFSGIINASIMKYAHMYGIHTLGLHCTDGDTIIFKSVDIDNCIYSDYNSLELINYLFSHNIIPIVSPTGLTKDNILFNIDADIISMFLAKALKARLIMLTDVSGVLDGKGHEIRKITNLLCMKLITEGVISSGMITKVNAALQVSKFLNQPVNITAWTDCVKLKKIFYGHAIGTTVIY